jgi:hypothetical protein
MTTTNQGCEYRGGSAELLLELSKDIEKYGDLKAAAKHWEMGGFGQSWVDCSLTSIESVNLIYRRKPEPPRRITIGAHSFPEPVRKDLSGSETYWVAVPHSDRSIRCFEWDNSDFDKSALKSGMMQLTRQGAIDQLAAIKALCNERVSG